MALSDTNGWISGWAHHPTPNQSSGMSVPSGVQGIIYHTMVGDLPGTDSVFMNPSFQASAHFGIAQDGSAIQWVNIRGGVAWAEMAGNYSWYSCEMADHGDPNNPYTAAQIKTAGELAAYLSKVGHFALQITNSTGGEGLGTHNMGGSAWGGHSCPDSPPDHVRSNQRGAIIAAAGGGGTAPPAAHGSVTALPPGRWTGKGMLTGKGTDGNTWYTATNDGRAWTAPSKTEPSLAGSPAYVVATLPPGWWKGTLVFAGTGTDKNRWHTSTANGSTWNTPQRT